MCPGHKVCCLPPSPPRSFWNTRKPTETPVSLVPCSWVNQPTAPCAWHHWPEAGPGEMGALASPSWTSSEFHLLLLCGAPGFLGPRLYFTHFHFISDLVVLGAHTPLYPWHSLSLRPGNSLQPGAGGRREGTSRGAACTLGGPPPECPAHSAMCCQRLRHSLSLPASQRLALHHV